MSRWRESSGRSSGSTIVPPGESSSANDCDEPHEVLEVGHLRVAARRRPRARTAARRRRERPCGRRRCGATSPGCAPARSNSRGALATCSSTNSGSRKTLFVLDLLARRAEVLDRLGEHELDAQLGDDPPPAAVEDGHRLLAQDLVAGHLVDVHAAPLLDDARCDRNISSMEQEFQASPGTQVIDRGAQLLALVLEAEAPRALGDLAADAGLPKSTASRLLGALERNGLVEQEGLRGAFRAGPVMARFAGRGISARRIVEAAERRWPRSPTRRGRRSTSRSPRPAASSTSRRSRAATTSARATGSAAACRTTAPPTARCCSRSPPPARRRARSRRSPRARSPSPRCSPPSSRTIRRDGFATAVDELELGLSAVAAPVLDDSGRAIAALSVSGPTLRLSPRRVAELRPIVIKQARALAEQLGHRTEGVHAA